MVLTAAHNNQSALFLKPAEQESSAYMAGYMAGAIAAESHLMSRLFRLDVQKHTFATDQAVVSRQQLKENKSTLPERKSTINVYRSDGNNNYSNVSRKPLMLCFYTYYYY